MVEQQTELRKERETDSTDRAMEAMMSGGKQDV
jgi:hypothetical protein